LVVAMLAVRIARREAGWWAAGVMAVLTFGACCLNEQPASPAPPLPPVAWAASPPTPPRAPPSGLDAPARGRARAWMRALAPAAVCTAAAAAYAAVVMADAPPGTRGNVENLVSASNFWARTAHFLDLLWRRVLLKNWASGALSEGWTQVTDGG